MLSSRAADAPPLKRFQSRGPPLKRLQSRDETFQGPNDWENPARWWTRDLEKVPCRSPHRRRRFQTPETSPATVTCAASARRRATGRSGVTPVAGGTTDGRGETVSPSPRNCPTAGSVMTPHGRSVSTADTVARGASTNQWIRFPLFFLATTATKPLLHRVLHPSGRTSDLCSLLPPFSVLHEQNPRRRCRSRLLLPRRRRRPPGRRR